MTVAVASSFPSEALARDYWELLKPRVMSLVIFTGGTGMILSPSLQQVHPFLLFVALLCLAVGAGATASFALWTSSARKSACVRSPFGLFQCEGNGSCC